MWRSEDNIRSQFSLLCRLWRLISWHQAWGRAPLPAKPTQADFPVVSCWTQKSRYSQSDRHSLGLWWCVVLVHMETDSSLGLAVSLASLKIQSLVELPNQCWERYFLEGYIWACLTLQDGKGDRKGDEPHTQRHLKPCSYWHVRLLPFTIGNESQVLILTNHLKDGHTLCGHILFHKENHF